MILLLISLLGRWWGGKCGRDNFRYFLFFWMGFPYLSLSSGEVDSAWQYLCYWKPVILVNICLALQILAVIHKNTFQKQYVAKNKESSNQS